MRILFIGDVVGSPGRDMIKTYLPKLKLKYKPNAVIVNGENAAHGKGITEKIYHQLIQAGADVLTMGNHTWDKRKYLILLMMRRRSSDPPIFPKARLEKASHT